MEHRSHNPPFRRSTPWALSCVCAALAWSSPAAATFSILAVETKTGVMGATAASCVGTKLSLSEIIAIDPKIGGVIAQALYFPEGRDLIFEALQAGASPIESLQAALDPAFDPSTDDSGPAHRQYAALTIGGKVAAFTGGRALPFAGDRTGGTERFVYSIQGNVLEAEGVLDVLEEGFLSSEGGVGAHLLAALQAVATAGQGDSRCSPLTADAAYFELHVPGGRPLEVEVVTPGGDATAKLIAEAAPLLPLEPEADPEDDQASPPGDVGTSASANNSTPGCRYAPPKTGGWFLWLLTIWGVTVRRLGVPSAHRRIPTPWRRSSLTGDRLPSSRNQWGQLRSRGRRHRRRSPRYPS